MTRRIACVILLSVVTSARANAQTTTSSSQPRSANGAADFPDEPSSGERDETAGYVTGNIGRTSTDDATARSVDIEGGFACRSTCRYLADTSSFTSGTVHPSAVRRHRRRANGNAEHQRDR